MNIENYLKAYLLAPDSVLAGSTPARVLFYFISKGSWTMVISDFSDKTSLNHQRLLIKSAEEKLTRQQSPYLKLSLADRSGEIGANLWDVTPQQILEFSAGKVVEATGKISSYKDRLQVDIQTLSVSPDQDWSSVMPSAPEDFNSLQQSLVSYYNQIKNPVYQIIVQTLLHRHKNEFFTWPAAMSVHHNFYHGLLFHTVSILRQLEHFADQYPNLDRELMYAGAILHDMGKTIELSGIMNTEYTTPGQLIGHISLIDGEINRVAAENHIDEKNKSLLLLRHMVLSHHGLQEYGSPVEPRILEATLLHQADVTDANINTISNQLKQTDLNEWTPKIWSQNNHSFYNHQGGQKDEA